MLCYMIVVTDLPISKGLSLWRSFMLMKVDLLGFHAWLVNGPRSRGQSDWPAIHWLIKVSDMVSLPVRRGMSLVRLCWPQVLDMAQSNDCSCVWWSRFVKMVICSSRASHFSVPRTGWWIRRCLLPLCRWTMAPSDMPVARWPKPTSDTCERRQCCCGPNAGCCWFRFLRLVQLIQGNCHHFWKAHVYAIAYCSRFWSRIYPP